MLFRSYGRAVRKAREELEGVNGVRMGAELGSHQYIGTVGLNNNATPTYAAQSATTQPVEVKGQDKANKTLDQIERNTRNPTMVLG